MRELGLIALAQELVGQPFVWGETDCAVVALRGIDAFSGTRHAEEYQGRWQTEAAAIAHFQTELPSEVLRRFGLAEISPRLAAIGDVILAPKTPFPECAHICLGKRALTASPENGVGYVRTADLLLVASSAWRAG